MVRGMNIDKVGYTAEQSRTVGLYSENRSEFNKAGYTATLVACGWAGAVLEKVTRASGQDAQKAQKRQKK